VVRGSKPPSQTWRTFLQNHLKAVVSIGFFAVTTLRFEILYVFLGLAHDRHRIIHFGVTAHPASEWTAQQLREVFPWDSAPRFFLVAETGTSFSGLNSCGRLKNLGLRKYSVGQERRTSGHILSGSLERFVKLALEEFRALGIDFISHQEASIH
jgi:hypothetical protein